MRQWLDRANADYGRVGAGTTGIHKACDRQQTFKSVKSKIKKVLSKQDCEYKNNRQLELTIRQAFANFTAIYSEVELGSTLQECYTTGPLVLVYCVDKVMTRAMVINGFTCCGQDCAPDPDGCTVDYYKMMHQCYTDISKEQLNIMQEMIPGLSEMFKLRGTVTYQEMIDRGILPCATSINRDDLSHIRHWSEIVNHEVVVARYEEERRRNDPAERARRRAARDITKAREREERANKIKHDREVRSTQLQIARAREKERFNALSPAEQKLEKDRKKTLKQAAKGAKQERDMKRLEDARMLLDNEL